MLVVEFAYCAYAGDRITCNVALADKLVHLFLSAEQIESFSCIIRVYQGAAVSTEERIIARFRQILCIQVFSVHGIELRSPCAPVGDAYCRILERYFVGSHIFLRTSSAPVKLGQNFSCICIYEEDSCIIIYPILLVVSIKETRIPEHYVSYFSKGHLRERRNQCFSGRNIG